MKRFTTKQVRLLSSLLVTLTLATVSSAQITVVSDPFTSGTNWGSTVITVSKVFTNGTDMSGGMSAGTSTGSLAIDTVTNQRVDFTASLTAQNPAPIVQAAKPLNFTAPSNSDWSVSVNATNTFSAGSGQQSVQIGMFVSNTSGLDWAPVAPPLTHDYVKLVLANNSGGPYIHGGLHLDGTPSPNNPPINPKTVGGISSTTGSLVFSYVASTQVITAGYNFNGTLIQFGSYGVAGGTNGSTANADWAMSGGTFTISLFGQASTSGSAYTLSSGTTYLDDFSTTDSVTSMTAPVPEPSTYAALFGVAALGFAAWRRRRQA